MMLIIATPIGAKAPYQKQKETQIAQNIENEITYEPKKVELPVWIPYYPPVRVVKLANTSDGCPTDPKQFIYCHESGNNPTRENSIGCIGLGQDCNGNLRNVCPALDYNCEDQFFTNYMIHRYGTWDRAKSFWVAHGWW
jgi:hypothetical protein